MKTWHIVLLAALAVAAIALVLHFHLRRSASGPREHTQSSFEFTVRAPFRSVVPLFGASAERGWGGSRWNPQWIYPLPERDQAGEVFLVAHGHQPSVWVNTAFDLEAGHVQYAHVIPGALVGVIDIQARPLDASTTAVKVTYQHTALDPALNPRIREMARQEAASGPEWEAAINGYLQAHPAR